MNDEWKEYLDPRISDDQAGCIIWEMLNHLGWSNKRIALVGKSLVARSEMYQILE